jgi:hypothetical protein
MPIPEMQACPMSTAERLMLEVERTRAARRGKNRLCGCPGGADGANGR